MTMLGNTRMTETAKVVKIEDDVVTLACSQRVCAACSAAYCNPKAQLLTARNPRGFALSPNDTVEVSLSSRSALVAGVLVFGLPLLLFGAAYAALSLTVPESTDALRVGGGMAALAAAYGGVYLFGRERLSDRPVITARR